MITYASKRKLKAALLAATAILICAGFAGCGGGGGNSAAPAAASAGSYTLISPASREIGSTSVTLVSGGATLQASLPATTTVTVTERFYSSGRPLGVAGKIYDIKPNGLPFKPGTQLCISYSGIAEYQPDELTIVTGENLDQQLASTLDSGRGRICAQLQHSSPYGLARVESLRTPDYTFFGDTQTKKLYPPKITNASGTDPERGAYSAQTISIDCNLKCFESGARTFEVIQGGAYAGDLYIKDDGSYPLWLDMDELRWMPFKNTSGAVVAGIPYLLAAEYMKYYGSGGLESYEAQLDPPANRIQRFFFKEGQTAAYLYIEIVRDDTAAPGIITEEINNLDAGDFHYVINRTTAAITKTWISKIDGQHTVSAAPGDASYTALNGELLNAIHQLVGIEDTPDYTTGNPHDEYPRYTPLEELFAVNVMNLLKGYGWNNIQQFEAYYRDRLKAMQDPAK